MRRHRAPLTAQYCDVAPLVGLEASGRVSKYLKFNAFLQALALKLLILVLGTFQRPTDVPRQKNIIFNHRTQNSR